MPDHVLPGAASPGSTGAPAPAAASLGADPDVLDVLHPALGPVRDADALDATLLHLARGAVLLAPEVSEAAFLVDLGGPWECRAATGPVARDLVAAELVAAAGPAHAAADARETVHLLRRALDEWPTVGDLAARHGVRALVCVPLLDGRRPRGVLVGVAPEVSLSTGTRRLLETVAAAAAGSVERLAHQQDVARALETRSLIGQAIGIVMERYDLTHDRAWDYLVRQASSRELKLALVAREVVDRRDQGAGEPGGEPTEPTD